ncbi:MAG: insulinase family protein [Cyanobacteria bacterium REEB459]|nr:insulinase family protein [Cyanobacteria bacterium REEB459]
MNYRRRTHRGDQGRLSSTLGILERAIAVAILVVLLTLGWGTQGAVAGASAAPRPTLSTQPYLDRLTAAVSEFTLDNGMKFIVLERHQVPVVSFMVYANVGAVNERDGKTGVAHYLEHLAFKGTSRIGSHNYLAERQVLAKMDRVFDQLLAAEAAGDDSTRAKLQAQMGQLAQQAATYVDQNKYGQIIEQAGGVGLNANTAADQTRYFYSLPANKLELWMSLESERLIDPVFRQFFEEKNVILEERRMRVDNSPMGTMVETFLEKAFEHHPYRRPVIGYQKDLYGATRKDIEEFYKTYYGPGSLTAVLVGDVDPIMVKQLAKAYFGRYPARPHPPEPLIQEPAQTAPRQFTLSLTSEPWYLEGYHRPGMTHPDHLVYGIIDSLLVEGRTSRLYQTLVDRTRVALDVGIMNGFPGDKYENIFLLYALTAPGHDLDQVATLFRQELDRLRQEPVSAMELNRVKTNARAELLRTLDSNSGMAALLAEYSAKTGDWRNLFKDLETIDNISAADVQRVARSLFEPNGRTVGKLLSASVHKP